MNGNGKSVPIMQPPQISQCDLNTKRMLDLMAGSIDDGLVPLYLRTVNRILRAGGRLLDMNWLSSALYRTSTTRGV